MNLQDTVDIRDLTIDPPAKDTPKSEPNDLSSTVDIRDMPKFIPTMVNDIQRNINVGNTGIGKSKFDKNIPLSQLENLNGIRAEKQPQSHQIANALVGGVGGGLMTAIEDVGYILDIDNNIKRLQGVENVESNFVSDWAKNNKEALYEALPIYRRNPDQTFDASNSGFYWEAFRGILDSAVGFGAVGMGAAGAVKAVGAGISGVARAGRVDWLKAYADLAGQSIANGRVGNVTAAAITNFGEGKMMGLELYEQSFDSNLESLINDYQQKNGIEPSEQQLKEFQLEASDIAGKQANDFIFKNMAFMVIEQSQLKSVFKGNPLTRSIIDKPSTLSFLKSQAINGPKEGLEEIGQNILQMEGQYQGEQELVDRGIEVKDAISTSDNFGKRLVEFGTSDQALMEGLMGMFGGPIQYAITTAPFQNKGEQRKRFIDQQTTISKNKEFLQNKLSLVANRAKAAEEEVKQGNFDKAELFKTQEFDNLAIENFAKGTTQNLADSLQEALSSEEYTPEEKENIQAKLTRLEEMEQEYVSLQKYTNTSEVLENRTKLRQYNDALQLLDTNTAELEKTLSNTFVNRVKAYNKKASADKQISMQGILDAVAYNDFTNLPKTVANEVINNPNTQAIVGNSLSYDDISAELAGLNKRYNNITDAKYQLGYNRFNEINLNHNIDTEEKIDRLNKLESDLRGANSAIKDLVSKVRSNLESAVMESKQKSEETTEPEVIKAKTKVANTKKKVKTTSPTDVISSKDLFGEPEVGEFDTETTNTTEEIDPELKKELDLFKKGKIAEAYLNGTNPNDIVNIPDEELRLAFETNPDEVNNTREALSTWDNLGEEDKKEFVLDFNDLDNVTLTPTNEIFGEANNEIAGTSNPKDPEVEVNSYNGITTEVNNNTLESQGKAELKGTEVDVKIVTPQATPEFIQWATQGIDHTGTEIQYNIRTGIKGENKEAYATFTALQRGEKVSSEDKRNMIDNLAIQVSIPNVPNATAFLYTVRPQAGMEANTEAERTLRTNIINNIIKGKSATGIIKGQYGGDLILAEENTSILNIPDFKEIAPKDIEFMYVTGEGTLNDADTRQPTKHDEFINTKVLLKDTKKPMVGALFVSVRKANGTKFPLKVNINPLSQNEKRAVVNLLADLTKPQPSTDKVNTLNKVVPSNIMNLLSEADRTFLGKSAKYKDVLSFLVYEGERSNSNPATQLFIKSGKVIFGANTIDLNNPLDVDKVPKLFEFLDTHKARSVDLRRLQSYNSYKNHLLNSGVITTNTNVSGNTLFGATELSKAYPNSVTERTANRYKSASLYVDSKLSNPITTIVSQVTTQVEQRLDLAQLAKEVPYTTSFSDVNNWQDVEAKINWVQGIVDRSTNPDNANAIEKNKLAKDLRSFITKYRYSSTPVLESSEQSTNLQDSLPVIDNTANVAKQKNSLKNKIGDMNLPNPVVKNNVDEQASKERVNKLKNKLQSNLDKINNKNKEENKDNCKGNK